MASRSAEVTCQARRRNNKFLWPREHGGWSMLGSACIVGAAASHGGLGASATIVVAFLLFVVREPLYAAMIGRNGWRQVVVTVALMLPPGLYLATHNPLTWIGAAAVFAVGSTAWHLHLRRCRRERSSAIEVLGIIQLTSAVPLVYLFGGANSVSHAMLLWLLVFAYYAGSLPYVRMRVRQAKMKERRSGSLMRIGVANLLYQICIAVLLIALILNNVMPAWVIIGFLPNIVKSVAHTFLPLKNLRMKQLGLAEMTYALVATIVLAVWAGGYVG